LLSKTEIAIERLKISEIQTAVTEDDYKKRVLNDSRNDSFLTCSLFYMIFV